MTRLTNWLVMPLRRVIPGVGGYDWASLLGAFLVALVAATILSALAGRLMPATVLLLA
ncbi:MAG: YggT family protein, partial [Lacisediminimonas sp.]|nr:YggT family protein [Lacisediminimonas sp.]